MEMEMEMEAGELGLVGHCKRSKYGKHETEQTKQTAFHYSEYMPLFALVQTYSFLSTLRLITRHIRI